MNTIRDHTYSDPRNMRITSLLFLLFMTTASCTCNFVEAAAPPATQPSPFEIAAVFPGSFSQGQPDTIVQPPEGCELLELHAADGTRIKALFGKPKITDGTAPKPALVFFYGNGMCMAHGVDLFNRFRSLGFNVIMADYEGYGMSGGTPSEAGCYAAADAEYDYLLTRGDVDKNRIVPVGWSLGGAVAIDLASRKKVAGLVTISAYTSIADMIKTFPNRYARAIGVVSRFDNLTKIATVPCPVFMAHGTRDPLVPFEMFEKLTKAPKGRITTFPVQNAGHNDVFQTGGNPLFNRIKSFVSGLHPVSPATQQR